jgi:hypothetical protein
VSYGIRRIEFDAYLLQRSGALVAETCSTQIARIQRRRLARQRQYRREVHSGRGWTLLPCRPPQSAPSWATARS